jgi:eukaryotic-like serine/threonine-protein kinase
VAVAEDGVPVVVAGLEVGEQLGSGARTVVYRARRAGVDYALKVRTDPGLAGERALREFRREAAMLASVDHPALPRIFEVGQTGERPYLVLELVDGRPLDDVLLDGPMPVDALLMLAQSAAGGLGAAHRAGLVHRDVKPANLVITADGAAKVIDFDLAGRPDTEAGDLLVGTVRYAAPEQTGMLRRPVDGRSDLYALGVVLYEAAAGRAPFSSADAGELARLHANAAPPPLSAARGDLPVPFAAAVARLLAKDPDDRYQSAADLLVDLHRMAGTEPAPGPASAGCLLIGRETEMTALSARWDRALAGQGGVALLRGAPGGGKSRLAAELVGHARDDGRLVLSGKGTADDPVPLAPLRHAVEGHLAELDRLGGTRREAGLARLREAAGGAAALLQALSPELGAVLAAPGPVAADRQEQFRSAVAGFLAALAREYGGALLHLDDVQWLDDATRGVLAEVAAELPGCPLLVVATARDSDADGTAAAVAAVRAALGPALDLDLPVRPLTDEAVAALTAAQLPGATVGPELAAELARRSGGNPFTLLEYLRALVDAGSLLPYWGHWQLDPTGLSTLELSGDVLDLIQTRVDGLGADTRRLLVVAAALGDRFDVVTAAAVAGADPDTAATALADAVGHRVVDARGHGDYAFVHDRIREALLAPLEAAELRALHQRIAEHLDAVLHPAPEPPEPGEPTAPVPHQAPPADAATARVARGQAYALARHYARGEPAYTPQRALAAAVAAGRLAMSDHSPAAAVAFLEPVAGLAGVVAAAPADGGADDCASMAWMTGAGDRLVSWDAARGAGLAGWITVSRHGGVAGGIAVAAGEVGPAAAAEHAEALGLAYGQVGRYVDALAALDQALAAQRDRVRRAGILAAEAQLQAGLWHPEQALASIGAGLAELGRPLRRGPLLALTALAAGLLGLLVGWFRIGYGGTGERRERDRLAAQLWETARYAATLQGRTGLLLATMMQSLYLVNRLGRPPAEHARLLVGFGLIARRLGLRRIGDRYLDRSLAVAARTGDPTVTAGVAWIRAAALQYADVNPGTGFLELLAEHGRWLELGDYLVAVSAAIVASLTAGQVGAAQGWTDRGEARLARGEHPMGASFSLAAAAVLAFRGQAGRAAELVGQARQARDAGPDRDEAVPMLLAEIAVLMEQDDVGPRFDAALAELRRLKVTPRTLMPVQLGLYVEIALGRLAQLAAAAPADRPERLAQARAAVTELGRAARGPLLRAYHDLAAAGLELATGDPATALRRLERTDRAFVVADAPLVAFRAARLRALTLRALGQPAAAARQARLALQVAIDEGWPHRVRGIRREFGLTDDGSTGSAALDGSEQRRRLAAVAQVSLAAGGLLDPLDVARVALAEMVRTFGAERAMLFLVDPAGDPAGGLVPAVGRDEDGRELTELTGYGSTLVQRVRDSGEALVVTGSEEGAALGSQSTVAHGLRSILVAPLRSGDRTLGVVYLDSRVAKGLFTAADLDTLTAITNYVAVALETARAAQLELAVQAERQQRAVAETLRAAMAELSATADPAEVVSRLLGIATRVLPADTACVLRTDDRPPKLYRIVDGKLTVRVPPLDPGSPELAVLVDAPGPVAGSAVDGSALTGRTVDGVLAELLPAEASGWLAVPLHSRGDPVGLLVLGRAGAPGFDDGHAQLAAALADQGMVAYENARLATVDGLTGLLNRRHFFALAERQVSITERHNRPLAAIMLDIDHFKPVNDRYGHAVGDQVIQAVAARLRATARDSDLVGRYGGEEFALLMPETGKSALVLAERLREAVEQAPVQTASGPLAVTVSIGVAHLAGQGGDISELLGRADDALYRAKAAGRNRVEVDREESVSALGGPSTSD